MIVFINPAPTLIPLHFLCLLSTICDFWLLNKYKFHFNCNLFQNLLPFRPYHFVRTILSIGLPLCPMTFYPCTILGFCSYHFVHTISSATILSIHRLKLSSIETIVDFHNIRLLLATCSAT